MMLKSEAIGSLAAALAKAQGEIEGAKKDKANPFFKSKYADLASVWDACREPLSKNGLAVVQLPELSEAKISMTTVLMHSSGEFISAELSGPLKEQTPQAIGSLVTYLRRYALSAIVGVAPDDDDAEAAMGRNEHRNGNGHSQPAKAKASDAGSVALMDELVQAVGAAKDDARLKQIIATVEGHLIARRLSDTEAKGVGEAIRARRKDLGIGATA